MLLLTHSVQRPPHSVGIFSRLESEQITQFVLDTYYRHFKLYRCGAASCWGAGGRESWVGREWAGRYRGQGMYAVWVAVDRLVGCVVACSLSPLSLSLSSIFRFSPSHLSLLKEGQQEPPLLLSSFLSLPAHFESSPSPSISDVKRGGATESHDAGTGGKKDRASDLLRLLDCAIDRVGVGGRVFFFCRSKRPQSLRLASHSLSLSLSAVYVDKA